MELTITADYLRKNNYNFTIDKQGHITLNGDFYCSDNNLTELKIPDNFTCGGDFYCFDNNLTELKIPDNFTCGGGFYCSRNNLTELKIPDNFTCGGDFYCSDNNLTELKIPDNKLPRNFRSNLNKFIGSKLTWRNGKYRKIDGIFCEVLKTKRNVIKAKLKNNKINYIICVDDIYSHGATIKEAKDSLLYKISDRDTSKYENYTLNTVISFEDAVKMYRCITGACEGGTRHFVENVLQNRKKKYTVREVIKETKGQYNNDKLQEFFKVAI